jgi:hypothetical protein
MAADNFSNDITLIAGADLSTHQFKGVKLDANGAAVLIAAATDVPIGVLQNKPTSGQAATVRVTGVTKMLSGGTITAGGVTGRIRSSNGTAIAAQALGTGPTEFILGQALQSNASGDVFKAIIDCINPGPNPVS